MENKRRIIMIDDGYLLLLARILIPDSRLVVKNGRAGITFKENKND